jgi:hypothetical protein
MLRCQYLISLTNSCRIALFVIGEQVRKGLFKGVRFLCGAYMLRYGLLIRLRKICLQQIETVLTSKETLITMLPFEANMK